MATLVLSAAGAAVGGLISTPILGLSGAVIGRAVGATLGRVIDQRLLGTGSQAVETGRIDRLRVTGADAGAPIPQIVGRMRVGGHVIWSTQFVESKKTTGGGKGAPPQPKTTTYSYSVSVAVALCEGEIARVGRIWADGVEIDRETVNWRLYTGTQDQMPDPLMEAVEGAGNVPAYRGTAYIVFEDLELGDFGNRVPQFAFEVVRRPAPERPHVPAAAEAVRAVAMMPGTGEYALATTDATLRSGVFGIRSLNVSAEGGLTDFSQSLQQLRDTCPNLKSVSLIYSWFGDDLRAGACSCQPKVEDKGADGGNMPWRAGGIGRGQAQEIARVDGRSIYGGTPADISVIQAIQAITEGGQAVTFYPFLLMEILAGNGLPDPYGGAEQAALPWRGRITGDLAPGQPGTPDQTALNTAAVAAFFGTASAADFDVAGETISYSGPSGWSYRRFILHCAALCKAAGGVEAFCIGSEMRGLTQMRDDRGFPAVDQLIALAAEVRSLLPDAKITYAADWSEYFGYHPQDGSGDVYFHLDALWADANIDMVAIDNYMPISDWREGTAHADYADGPIHALSYLSAGIEGGEGYDWYYTGPEAQAAQRRTEITDGKGEPWLFRYKDLRNWWASEHVERRGGERLSARPQPDGAMPFEGDFSAGGAYWVDRFSYDAADLPTAASLLDARADCLIVPDPDYGQVLQISDNYRQTSERVLHPIVPGQQVRIRLVTRLLSAPDDGEEQRYFGWLLFHNADGSFATAHTVERGQGLQVADGWIEVDIVVDPSALVGHHGIPQDASGWRFMFAGNGWTPHDPTGAVQQFANIRIDVLDQPTAWVPQSKPLWFTEFGCAAIDKATNQPNKFLDPKSSESDIPHFSNGRRDDLIQAQYLRAVMSYWDGPENNPISDVYGGPMLDMDRAHAWAWDARPWPAFPNDRDRWSDGENWSKGHWLTGRLDAQPLDLVVAEICERAGVTAYDVSNLHGLVRGHASAETQSARARLQPLMMAYGFHAVERDGMVVFLPTPDIPEAVIAAEATARDDDDAAGLTHIRAPEAEMVGRLRIGFTEAEGEYGDEVAEAIYPGDGSDQVSDSSLPMTLTRAEGQAAAERWLAEGRVGQDMLRFALPPSRRAIGAGALVATEDGCTWRVDRVEDRGFRQIEAIRVEPSARISSDEVEDAARFTAFVPPLPVTPIFMDLPLLTGDEVEHAPHLAVAATPWPGAAAVYDAPGPDGYGLNTIIDAPAVAGTLETPLFQARSGLWNRVRLRVKLETGALSAADPSAVLGGANAAAIGSGQDDVWEIVQFADATLIAPETWEIGLLLRGQQGTDGVMPQVWPAGTVFVLLDGSTPQITLNSASRGLVRHWRVGPARRAVDDASYTEEVRAFNGVGLRPYAPVHLRSKRFGAATEITWIRRSRIDADTWEGPDVPLGEASEQYLLRITDAQALRREAVLSSPAFTYTDAMRAADGTQSPFAIEVAQVSERFGPGPFARIVTHD